MTKPATLESQKKRIVFGTTVGMSAMALLRGQLAWFREQGWDVTLVASPDSEAERAAKREQITLFGIPMKRDISLLHDLKSLAEWIRLIRRVSPDVVNVGTPKASLLGIFASWVCRVPRRIYTIRGLRLEGAAGPMAKLLWLMERITIKMATDVIAVSPSLGEELVKRKLASPGNIWIIGSGSSNGVDAAEIRNRIVQIDRNKLRKRLGIEPTKFVVGYIGRVSRSKGFDKLLDAVLSNRLSDEVVLLVLGAIEDDELGKAINATQDRIYMVPWTDNVGSFLPAIDLLCLPTLREGFPNTVIEAAAAGIPAVTTRATGAIDSVIDGETGYLIEVCDVDALADRVNSLVDNPILLRTLGNNAQIRAEKDFKPKNIWAGIEAIAEGRHGSPQLKTLDKYMESRD